MSVVSVVSEDTELFSQDRVYLSKCERVGKFLVTLKECFRIEGIILYGSFARGL